MNYFLLGTFIVLVVLFLLNKQKSKGRKSDPKFLLFSKNAKKEHAKHQSESGVLLFWGIAITVLLVSVGIH